MPNEQATREPGSEAWRLDLMPWVALDGLVELGEYVAGPLHELGPPSFGELGFLSQALETAAYFIDGSGRKPESPTVIVGRGSRVLPARLPADQAESLARSIQAFSYLVLRANRNGMGANSTHLHVETFTFKGMGGPYLTIRSRYSELWGVRHPQFHAFAHLHPAMVSRSQLDERQLDVLTNLVPVQSGEAVAAWRSLYWFNEAHHDDPYQIPEFSLLALASAMEALLRPRRSRKVRDLQDAVADAVGGRDFDRWVSDFYGARNAIVHGEPGWESRYGHDRHITHYEVARELFQVVFEYRLEQLGGRGEAVDPFWRAFRTHAVKRLIASNRELFDKFRGLSLDDLEHAPRVAFELSSIGVLLNARDASTTESDYAGFVEWLHALADRLTERAIETWPDEADSFDDLRSRLRTAHPGLSHGSMIPVGVDVEAWMNSQMELPQNRNIVPNLTLTDLATAIQEVEWRRELARLHQTQSGP